MRAVAWRAPETLEPLELDEPAPGPGQAVVEVVRCGICGSDLHAYAHGYGVRPGQVLGHELSGRVVAAPGVPGLTAGQRVAVRPAVPCGACAGCRAGDVQDCTAPVERFLGFGLPGGFAERLLVPVAVAGGTVFPLPDSVSEAAGAVVEPLAVALHAVRLAGAIAGRVTLVLGAGTIGLGVVRLLRLAGAGRIVVADPSVLRRDRALALGADHAVDPGREDPVEAVGTHTGAWSHGRGARADAVFDCAGAPGTFATALDAAGHRASVVVAAMGATRAEFRPDVIAVKELAVRGSLTYRDEFAPVIALLADGSIDAAAFISHTVPLGRLEEGFALARDAERSLKVLVNTRVDGS